MDTGRRAQEALDGSGPALFPDLHAHSLGHDQHHQEDRPRKQQAGYGPGNAGRRNDGGLERNAGRVEVTVEAAERAGGSEPDAGDGAAGGRPVLDGAQLRAGALLEPKRGIHRRRGHLASQLGHDALLGVGDQCELRRLVPAHGAVEAPGDNQEGRRIAVVQAVAALGAARLLDGHHAAQRPAADDLAHQ